MTLTLIVVLGALIGAASWYKFWKGHAAKFEQSGYVPPSSSIFGKLGMTAFAYLLTFLTVGKVKVIGRRNVPRKGRVIFAANHQLPCDFAMVRRGSGRHFRMLTAADQLKGFFGMLSAAGGVISVAFKEKTDGQKAQDACVRVMADDGAEKDSSLRKVWSLGVLVFTGLCAVHVAGLISLTALSVLGVVVLALTILGTPTGSPTLGIFPQGALLPDDQDFVEHFRPGAVKIAVEAAHQSGEHVEIVPMAILYKWEKPSRLSFLDRKLKGMRSMFLGTRNPKAWNPLFKKSLEGLSAAEVEAIEAERKEIMRAHKKSNVTNYGGVVVVGKPVSTADLPADPIAAIAIVRARILELYAEAKRH